MNHPTHLGHDPLEEHKGHYDPFYNNSYFFNFLYLDHDIFSIRRSIIFIILIVGSILISLTLSLRFLVIPSEVGPEIPFSHSFLFLKELDTLSSGLTT